LFRTCLPIRIGFHGTISWLPIVRSGVVFLLGRCCCATGGLCSRPVWGGFVGVLFLGGVFCKPPVHDSDCPPFQCSFSVFSQADLTQALFFPPVGTPFPSPGRRSVRPAFVNQLLSPSFPVSLAPPSFLPEGTCVPFYLPQAGVSGGAGSLLDGVPTSEKKPLCQGPDRVLSPSVLPVFPFRFRSRQFSMEPPQ